MDRWRWARWLGALALSILGASLLAINAIGLVSEYDTRKDAAAVSPQRAPQESDEAYFARITRELHAAIPAGPPNSRYSEGVALTDNYLLAVGRLVKPTLAQYEFTRYERALNRGTGVCSQLAAMEFDILRRNGYSPKRVLWPEHTVVEAKTRDGRVMVLDPTLGVVIPHSVSELRRRPGLAAQHVRGITPESANLQTATGPGGIGPWIEAIYARPPDAVLHKRAFPQMSIAEPILYVAKWAVPILLLGLATVVWLYPRLKA